MPRHSDSVNNRLLGKVLAKSFGKMTWLNVQKRKNKFQQHQQIQESFDGWKAIIHIDIVSDRHAQHRKIYIKLSSFLLSTLPIFIIVVGVFFTVFNARVHFLLCLLQCSCTINEYRCVWQLQGRRMNRRFYKRDLFVHNVCCSWNWSSVQQFVRGVKSDGLSFVRARAVVECA
jgi:hypothetical protein